MRTGLFTLCILSANVAFAQQKLEDIKIDLPTSERYRKCIYKYCDF